MPSLPATVCPSTGRSNISSNRRPLGDGSRLSSLGSPARSGMMRHVSPRGVARQTITRFPLLSASPNDSNAASDRITFLTDSRAAIAICGADIFLDLNAARQASWELARVTACVSEIISRAPTDSGVSLFILRLWAEQKSWEPLYARNLLFAPDAGAISCRRAASKTAEWAHRPGRPSGNVGSRKRTVAPICHSGRDHRRARPCSCGAYVSRRRSPIMSDSFRWSRRSREQVSAGYIVGPVRQNCQPSRRTPFIPRRFETRSPTSLATV